MGPYLSPNPGPFQVPFFPGQEDATVLIQRITDEVDITATTPRVVVDDRPPGGPDDGDGAARGGPDDEPMRTARTGGVVRAGAMMAVATLASRITGFIAKALLLGVIGLTLVNDSYNLANTLPNIVFELVIGGVLTSVAIPLLSRARADPDGGQAYTQRLMTMALVGLIVVTVLAVLAAPVFTAIYSSDSSHADPELTTRLARLLLPQIFFYGIAALFGAILNTKERFAAPAWAPLANNLVVIAVAIVLGSMGGISTTGLTAPQLLLLGLGTTAGIVVQAAVMLPSLLRSGFRFRWRWGGDQRLAEAGGLMLWSIAYALISAVSFVVTTRVFTEKVAGALSGYSFASMLFQLPYGILGVSVLTAIMPRMSRHAANGDIESVKDDASLANRLSAIALMPVAVAMLALSGPLAVITTRYGKVDAAGSAMIGGTLAGFALGLVPLAVTLVQMRVFYAMKDARTPTLINAVMVAVRIPLILLCANLRTDLIAPGIAVATTASYLVGAVVGEAWLRARFGAMGTGRLLLTVLKMTLAAGLAGVAAWWVVGRMSEPVGASGAIIRLLVGGAVGLIVLVPAMLVVRLPEVDPLRRRIAAALGFGPRPVVSDGVAAAAPSPTSVPQVAPSMTHTAPARPARAPVPDSQESDPVVSVPPGSEPARPPADEATPADAPPTPTDAPPTPTDAPPTPTDAPTTPTDAPTTPTDSGADETVSIPPPPGSESARPPADEAPPAPGVTIGGRYRLVSQVAVDAAGNRFWRAKDTVLPRDMAVTLLPDSSGTSATVARTLRAGRLHHIGLPQTLDLGTDRGQTFVVGQWVDGATLTDLLARGPLEPAVASSIAGKISEAVAEAHRNGLSLGSISPSLVRVNVDGQVRFSHVIAHAAATPDEDIRALGAVLYLMLTGTWPAGEQVPMVPGANLKAAPHRNGREIPADEANEEVPAPLADLTERALHPEDPNGIHAVGALATLLRSPEPAPSAGISAFAGAPAGPGRPAPEPPPPTMSPADRKLRKERRVKLGLAASLMAVFVALMLIIVATLAKNALTGINESNAAGFDQLAESSQPTVSATTAKPAGGQGSSGPTGNSSSAGSATTTAPAAKKVKIIGSAIYDPEGQGSKDYEDLRDRLYDGDPSTEWLTWVYKQQFKPKAEGGYKVGVGVVLQFERDVTPQSVEITVPEGAGEMTVEIRTAGGMDPGPLAGTTVVGSGTVAGGPAAIPVSGAPKSPYLLVFLTQIPGSGNTYQAKIGEIVVNGN